MTAYVPPGYVEHQHTLALGVEPIDAMLGTRIADSLRVTLDGVPFPKPPWGNTPSTHWFEYPSPLQKLPRRSSSLHALLQGPGAKSPVAIRLFDRARHFVPRRFSIALSPDHNVSMVSPHLFPGAAYDLSHTATALRGRVLFKVSRLPYKWARILALLPGTSTVVGRAQGDDRGEFLLMLSSATLGFGAITNPIPLEIQIWGRLVPLPLPVPVDLALPSKDPLWELPVETLAFPADPDVLGGLIMPPDYVEIPTSGEIGPPVTPRSVNFVPGRLTSEPDFLVH